VIDQKHSHEEDSKGFKQMMKKHAREKGVSEMEKLVRFLKDEDGVTAIEYGLIATVIALGILLAVQGVRGWLVEQFEAVAAITP